MPTSAKANLGVYGWIRSNQLKIDKIPIDIIHLCVAFYSTLEFYTKKSAKKLLFDNQELSVTISMECDKYYTGTCLFGDWISASECDRFDLYFKYTQMCPDAAQLVIGYIASSIRKSIGDWYSELGLGQNKKFSKGFIITSRGIFRLLPSGIFYPSGLFYSTRYSMPIRKPEEGDEFGLTIDFISDTVSVWFEGTLGVSESLEGIKRVYPALSLRGDRGGSGQRVKVQITKWKYYKDNKSWAI